MLPNHIRKFRIATSVLALQAWLKKEYASFRMPACQHGVLAAISNVAALIHRCHDQVREIEVDLCLHHAQNIASGFCLPRTASP